jgi:hypothetical protein
VLLYVCPYCKWLLIEWCLRVAVARKLQSNCNSRQPSLIFCHHFLKYVEFINIYNLTDTAITFPFRFLMQKSTWRTLRITTTRINAFASNAAVSFSTRFSNGLKPRKTPGRPHRRSCTRSWAALATWRCAWGQGRISRSYKET